jgi:hypothetical protein
VATIITPANIPPPLPPAGTCTVTVDPSYASVLAAVNAASPGDTICVTAGSATWSSQLTINTALTLKGAGIGNTIINHSGSTTMLRWNTVASGLHRLTGFTINGSSINTVSLGVVEFFGSSQTVRIDHNRFALGANKGFTAVKIWNYVRGVGDNNIFDLSALDYCCGYYVHHDFWNGPGGNDNKGDRSWAYPDTWGTDQAWYWETNTIVYDNTGHPSGQRHTITSDGWMGSRVVNRFNTYQNSQLSGGHGTDSGGRWRGRRQTENYRETLAFDCTNCGGADPISPLMAGRGATMMVWDNTITATGGSSASPYAIGFGVDRNSRTDATYVVWGFCGETSVTSLTTTGAMTTAVPHGIAQVFVIGSSPTQVRISGATGADAAIYNGIHDITVLTDATHATIALTGTPGANATGTVVLTSPWDGNTTSSGYPCLDQIGYGQSDLLQGTAPTTAAWPNQVLTPSLYWNNTYNGAPTVPVENPPQTVLDREFHTDTTISRGTIAARPATCTTGTLYWATDQGSWNTVGASGKLYRCTAPNTWTAWYGSNNATGEPLTYPHPVTLL